MTPVDLVDTGTGMWYIVPAKICFKLFEGTKVMGSYECHEKSLNNLEKKYFPLEKLKIL